MKSIVKRICAICLVIVMVMTCCPASIFAFRSSDSKANSDSEYIVDDFIEFGSYPQSDVKDESIISSLNSIMPEDDLMQKNDYMMYADVLFDGIKYRAIKFDEYRHEFLGLNDANGNVSTKQCQKENGYYTDNVYWFKFEPLKWQILDSETGLVLCNNIIDSQPYNKTCNKIGEEYYCNDISEEENYANSYYNSALREWLNDDFYNTAFNADEKEKIHKTYLSNKAAYSEYQKYGSQDSSDNVFIPSVREMLNATYGFNSDSSAADKKRLAEITDYSKAQGIYTNDNNIRSCWWLRNYTTKSNNAGVVLNDNGKIDTGVLYSTGVGVRPAIRLDFIKETTEKISIDRSAIYSDSTFIHYGTQMFYDSLFEYSNNGMVPFNNRSSTTLKSVLKDNDCPTNSKNMIQITTNGVAEPGLGGYVQRVNGTNGSVLYHVILAKIPKGYRLQSSYNTLYYGAEVNYLTSTKGTGNWELYIIEVKYGLLISNTPIRNADMGFIYLTCEDSSLSENVTWFVGYSNVFDKTGERISSDGGFGSSNASITFYNNNYESSNNVSVSRVPTSYDCPNPNGYMLQVKTDPGTSFPGYGGFIQLVMPERGYTYYHKFIAKIPVGNKVEYKSNLVDGVFEWVTDNRGTGEWETYIYKLNVWGNAQNLESFGYVALYPMDFDNGNEYSTTAKESQAIENNETLSWYLAYSNIYKLYEFNKDFKACDLAKGAGISYNGHSYIRYDYPVSWHMAKCLCERIGGHLVTITSSAENDTVSRLFASLPAVRYWIGATDKAEEGSWKWVTGEPFSSYSKWSSGQPDNMSYVEHYLEIWESDGSWNDNEPSSNGMIGFICEFDNHYIPAKTVEQNGHLYSIYNEKLTWTDAEAVCEAVGGHLVSITSAEEQNLVEDLIKNAAVDHFWIGATDKDSEGTWKWIDSGEAFWKGDSSGSASGYSNWSAGEPNNSNDSTGENYGMIYGWSSTDSFKWNDIISTDKNYGFICEVDTTKILPDSLYCYNGNKYEVYDKTLTWIDAKLLAEMKGGHLVTITTSNEQDFIKSIVEKRKKLYYLIGADCYNDLMNWRWIDNEPWEGYDYWNAGQPDFWEYNEFFGMVYSSDTILGEWNDLPNLPNKDLNTGFIIEYDDYYKDFSFYRNDGASYTSMIISSIRIDTLPLKTTYYVGEKIDLDGLVLSVNSKEGSTFKTSFVQSCSVDTFDAEGSQKVTVYFEDASVDFIVNVYSDKPKEVYVKTAPTKTEYFVGEELDLSGLTLSLKYNSGNIEEITEEYTVSTVNMSEVGEKAVRVSYNGLSTEFNITVNEILPTEIEILAEPDKLNYYVGDIIDLTGLSAKVTYNNGSEIIINDGFVCDKTVLTSPGHQNITVSFDGINASLSVNVSSIVPVSLEIKAMPSKTVYYIDDTLALRGLSLAVKYNNGDEKIINDLSKAGFTYDFNSAGSKTVEINYEENGIALNNSFYVTVREKSHLYSENISTESGQTIAVPVYLNDNYGVSSFKITLKYDPEALTPVSVEEGKILGVNPEGTSVLSILNSNIDKNPNGNLDIIWSSSEDMISNGKLFTVYFDVADNADGEYVVSIDYDEESTSDEHENNIKLDCSDAIINVEYVETTVEPTVKIDSVSVKPGDTISIPVKAINIPETEDFEINVLFDKNVFSYIDVSADITDDYSVKVRTTGIRVTFDCLPETKNAIVFTINLKVFDSASGEYEIELDADDVNIENAVITVVPNPTSIFAENVTVEEVGETISVPVYIKDNKGIMGYGINMEYDEEYLSFVSIDRGIVLTSGSFDYINNDNLISVFWFENDDVAENGELFTAIFTVNKLPVNRTEIKVSYSQDDTFNSEWNDVVLVCENVYVNSRQIDILFAKSGTNTVVDREFIYGLIPGTSLLESYVDIADGYVIDYNVSDILGTGTIVNIKKNDETVKEYYVVIFGDVNGDGLYDGMDSVIVNCLVNGILSKEQVGEAKWLAADCNHDGVIDSADVAILEQAGLVLTNIDQSKTPAELFEDAAFCEYISLIDQNSTVETTVEETHADITPTDESVDERFNKSFIERLIDFIIYIVNLMKTFIAKL